jgi:hypothetical protein
MWIAKWRDYLQDEWKYVWLSDSSYVKQKREIEKFDKAKLKRSLKKAGAKEAHARKVADKIAGKVKEGDKLTEEEIRAVRERFADQGCRLDWGNRRRGGREQEKTYPED